MPTREDALILLNQWITKPGLLGHSLAVEAAMRTYAAKFGGNPEEWGICGLLHDMDYEKFPLPDGTAQTGHPFEGVKVLRTKGYPASVIEAILGHATYSGTPRVTPLAKCLFACDELCGFLVAIAYMRPDKLAGITPEVVAKYLKKKKFAEKVSREEIAQGIAELGVPTEEHYATVTRALQGISQELGF